MFRSKSVVINTDMHLSVHPYNISAFPVQDMSLKTLPRSKGQEQDREHPTCDDNLSQSTYYG